MRLSITSITVCAILTSFLLTTGCDKKEDPVTEPLTNYLDLTVGKSIRYRLDSTVFINFDQQDTVISYQAKDSIEGTFTDIFNRPGFRVQRYHRGLNSTNENDWAQSTTYFIIPDAQTVEFIESGLRFVKLNLPVWEGHSWWGNGFLPTDAFSQYEFSNDIGIQTWDYTYQDVGAPLTINNQTFDNTITVLQVDDEDNVDDPTVIGFKNYWVEKYAKGIGLVYKEVIMWERQPPTSTTVGSLHGFGIKLSIISHN
jgi:hypothetical protein